MKAALIGFFQSGKSTLLSAVSGKNAAASGGTQIDEVVVPVPDERLDWLTGLYRPKKTTHATIDSLDVPGLNLSDSAGRAATERLLTQIRTVDMFVIVARGFEEEAVPAYRGSIDPRRDVAELLSELLIADLEQVTTRIDKLKVQVLKSTKTQQQDKEELALQLKLQAVLENQQPARVVTLTPREEEIIRPLGLLTLKPIMVVVNVGEKDAAAKVDLAGAVDASVPVISLCAKIEQELRGLDEASRKDFMADLGISESAVSKFVNSCYSAMGLVSFLTVGEDEVRAWPIRRDSTALDAAGKIHSDIKRGFIRAETMSYADLKMLGDEKAVKAAGRMRLEGKTYVVQDGDIINFRFNV